MAEFKGEMSVRKEESALEIDGTFVLTDEELAMVTGGIAPDKQGPIDFNMLRTLLGIIFRPLDDKTDGTGSAQ